jgi:enterobactin synthetase component D
VPATLCLARLEVALAHTDVTPLLPSALRRAVRKRQLSFIGGRLCAERCLSDLGLQVGGLQRGPHGEPLWPERFLGSITHSDTHAHAIATPAHRYSGVGIDSERIVASSNEIFELCCTVFERNAWFEPKKSRSLSATLLFSIKESFYKAIHRIVNRFVDFDEVEVVSWDASRSQVRLRAVSADLSQFAESACVSYRLQADPSPCIHTAVLIPRTSSIPST